MSSAEESKSAGDASESSERVSVPITSAFCAGTHPYGVPENTKPGIHVFTHQTVKSEFVTLRLMKIWLKFGVFQ